MQRDTIIFDLDGTLLDTLDDLTASVNYCMDKYGGPRHTREEVREKVGNGIYVLIEKSLPGGRDNPSYKECAGEFAPYYRKHMMDATRPYEGIGDLLAGLAGCGYRTAIVSNKFDAAVKELKQHFFAGDIQVAVGEAEADGIRKKPEPDMVFAAMKELEVAPKQCIYVGDSDVDIRTAANAGIPCICVTWGFKTRDFLKEHGAEEIVDSPEELLEKILHFAD
ncbi:MAG: HAD family hydrolase [Lachnospiraceae bacterium]|nr:HAD family hydrolase [Lachnospiraceae bacterium]